MAWTSTFDGVFFISLATLLTGSFGLMVKYCLRAKCEHISICCGLVTIHRRVDLEVQEEIKQIEMKQMDAESKEIEQKV
jgi:hypothetical protein